MILKKITAVLLGIACIACFSSCEKENDKTSDISVSVGEDGVGELITPAEDDEDYELGSYRIDKNGIKLYYEDEGITPELMIALEEYFTSFQNNDYEAYKDSLYPDYAERYSKYLGEEFGEDYTLENSFELQCGNIRDLMINAVNSNEEYEADGEPAGDFKITRVRGEALVLDEGESIEDGVKTSFEYLNNIFGVDYYETIKDDVDEFKGMEFFVIAEGEDGNEHLILSGVRIVFAVKDGKYYTFG